MRNRLPTRQFYIWLACFAILMNALAPSVSHALASSRGVAASWEVCRAGGPAAALAGRADLVAAVGAPGKHSPAGAGAMDVCGYCVTHGGSHALLPVSLAGLGMFGSHALRPFLFYRAAQPLLALTAAPPRGPPALA